jgi:hypothetical protein
VRHEHGLAADEQAAGEGGGGENGAANGQRKAQSIGS